MIHRIILLTLLALVLQGQNPNTAAFPTTVATDTNLAVAKRLSQSTLSTTINSAVTSVVVADGTQFLTQEIIRIDSEEMFISGISTNTLTVTRGFNSTTAASHTAGATVQGIITSYHHNQMAAEMKAVQAWMRDYLNRCQDAGSNDTYACSMAPPITSYVTGGMYAVKAATANTGAATVNFNSVGAKTIKKTVGGITTDLADNDIRADMWVVLIYDGTNMQMINQLGNAVASVAWGSITGTLSSQTDVQSAITAAAGTAAWGGISGTLSSQSDLQTALNAKLTTATLQAGTPGYCRSTSGNDTYVCGLTPALTAYTRGGCLTLDADTANTGAATVNVDSLGAKSILNRAGSALSNGDITANKPIQICYDGTQYIIQGDGGGGSAGTAEKVPSCTDTGTVNALVCDPSPSISSLVEGLVVSVVPANSNTSSGPTINVSSLGVKPIYRYGVPGQLIGVEVNELTAGYSYLILYTLASDAFVVIGQHKEPPGTVLKQAYCPASTSSPTTYACTPEIGGASLASGTAISFGVGATACTGSTATTLNVGSLGAKRVYRSDGTSDPLATECPAGAVLLLVYDTSLTSGAGGWRIVGGTPGYTNGTGISLVGNQFSADFSSVVGIADTSTISGNKTFTGSLDASGATVKLPDAYMYCADAGSNDTYACSISPAPSAYATGKHYRFKANTVNTGAATVNFNSLGAKTIKKVAGGVTTDLADNDIRAGQMVDLVYDGTNMQMQSTLGNAGGSSTITDEHWYPVMACNESYAVSYTNWITQTGGLSNMCSSTFYASGYYLSNASSQKLALMIPLHASWTGNVDVEYMIMETNGATGNVQIDTKTACFGSGGANTPSFNAAQSTTINVSSGNKKYTGALTSATTTGCSAGNSMIIEAQRINSGVSGNLANDIVFLGAKVTTRHN